MKLVSVVIPAFNEAGSLGELHERLARVAAAEARYNFEFLVVDDGSSDATLETLKQLRARDPRLRFLSLSRNFGHQAALSAGLDEARGDAVVFMDGDLQHPPEMVRELLRRWEAGAQVVNTIRADGGGVSLLKRTTSSGFYRLINWLGDTRISASSADFRLLDRRAADALRQIEERARFIRGLVQWIGFRHAQVEFTPDKRFAGRTKYSWKRMMRLASDGIFSFSTVPLKIATWLGLLVSAAALAYGCYALYTRLIAGTAVPGWTSLLVTVLALGGIQLLTLGILGSYIARIFDEARRRPLYLVKESSEEEAAARETESESARAV
jgi:dolichol-phosphate mannosyltransferase